MALLEQVQLTLPEPGFSGVGVDESLDFCIVFSRSLDVPSVLFPLAIILGIDPVVLH